MVTGASPVDGPDGDPAERDLFANWSSSDENTGPRPAALPVRFGPEPGSGTVPQAARVPPPTSGWDSRIAEVVGIEGMESLYALLAGWSDEERISAHRCGAPYYCRSTLSGWARLGSVASDPL